MEEEMITELLTDNRKKEEDYLGIVEFNHLLWLEKWNRIFNNRKYSLKNRKTVLKKLLREVEESTKQVCKREPYLCKYNKRMLYEEDLLYSIQNTKRYNYKTLEQMLPIEYEKKSTSAHFIKRDIVDVGLFVDSSLQKNPLLMISSDPCNPGGDDHFCLFGMESAVWRRTAIRECLTPKRRSKYVNKNTDNFKYLLEDEDVVYCPKVPTFRTSGKEGYSFLPSTKLSYAFVTPVYRPELIEDSLSESDRELMKKKIEEVFMTAIVNQHKHIIVSAFGCGKAKCPPKDISSIFVEVIKKYKKYPLDVIFACLDDIIHESNSEGNVYPFSLAFKSLEKVKKSK